MADINIEKIVIGFLDANKLTGWAVHGDMPDPRPQSFILVDRTGGPRENIVQDRAEILIEIYHKDSREVASDEANRTADIVKNLESLEPIMRAKVNSIVKLDDLLGQFWRYQIYCDIFYRRDVSSDGIIYPVIPTAGAVISVNGQTGVVVLDADDIDDTSTTNKFATATQLSNADSAVQPGDLATVATSGSYSDLTGKPSIPASLGDLSGTSDDVTQGTTNLFLTSAERTKLSNTSGTNTGDQTTITGNAGTATKLQTARNINGVAFDGTADITVADSTKVPTTTTVNGHALSANVTVSKSDVGLGSVTNDAQLKASDLDTTTTLGTSDVKVPSQKAVKTYVDTNNTAALTTYDSTYLQSIGLSATTNTQDSVDGLAAGVFTYLGTIPNTYLNQTGQSGGQTAYGGFTSSDDLTIGQSNAAWSSTSTGRTKIKGLVQFVGQTSVVNGAFPGLISFNETVNISGASVWALAGFAFNPTFQQDTSFGFGAAPAFNASPIFQPTAGGLNDSTHFLISGYTSSLNHKLAHSGAAGATAMTAGYADSPSFIRASGTGTHTIDRYSSLTSYQPVLFSYHVGAGYTATTMSTVYARNPSVSGGTITNNIAIDIAPMTSGSTINAGIRNASATINTPGTAQNITAASQAITIASTVKQLTANASYTLTSAPTIANGQDGQVVTIVNVDTTDTITLQDQGTLAGSNLRLSASSIALGPRDSIQLMYSSTIGDWVQIGQTNVI